MSFDEDDTGAGTFSRVNVTGKSGSFSYGSPTDTFAKTAHKFQTIPQETVTTSSNISANVESTGFKTIENSAGAITNENQSNITSQNSSQSSAMTQNFKSGAMFSQSDDVFQNGASLQTSENILRSGSRDPSIASGRSDNRRSQGSFSSADFELRYSY